MVCAIFIIVIKTIFVQKYRIANKQQSNMLCHQVIHATVTQLLIHLIVVHQWDVIVSDEKLTNRHIVNICSNKLCFSIGKFLRNKLRLTFHHLSINMIRPMNIWTWEFSFDSLLVEFHHVLLLFDNRLIRRAHSNVYLCQRDSHGMQVQLLSMPTLWEPVRSIDHKWCVLQPNCFPIQINQNRFGLVFIRNFQLNFYSTWNVTCKAQHPKPKPEASM